MVELRFELKPVHLVMEGRLARIPDLQELYVYLTTIVDKQHMDMTAIGEPVLAATPVELIGFQIIAESHISVHVCLAQQYLFADLFSCKEFDIRQALQYSAKYFDLAQMTHQVVDRFAPKLVV